MIGYDGGLKQRQEPISGSFERAPEKSGLTIPLILNEFPKACMQDFKLKK